MKIEGKFIEVNATGVAGDGWRAANEDNCPAQVRQEITERIIDGRQAACSDYAASNGLHYRWG